MHSSTHIINRVYLEVHTQSKKTGYELKDKLGALLEQELLPNLETYFDKIVNEKNLDIIQLENLQLNINHNKQDDYKQLIKSIKESFIETFERKLKSSNTEEIQFITKQKNLLNSFFVFLEEGVLPWDSSLNQNKVIDSESIITISKHTGFKLLFKEKLKKENSRIRLINQFDNQNIAILLKKAFEEKTHHQSVLSDAVIHTINKVNPINRKVIWVEIINYLLTKNKQEFIKRISQFIESIKNQTNLKVQQKESLMAALVTIVNTIDVPKQTSIEKIFKEKKLSIDNTTNDLEKNHKELHEQNAKPNIKTKKQINKSERIKNDTLTNHPDNVSKNKYKKDKQDNSNTILENKKNDLSQNKLGSKEKTLEGTPFSDKELFQSQNKQEYYVQNAGLILIQPFLKQFFDTCGLLDDQNQIRDKELAAHLLHYIATKKEKQSESSMVFEKFLCGIPIKQSIKRDISISNKLKEQVNDLLQSVLDNWEILKDASIDLLRNEFLQRPGKLSFKSDSPKIIIERKTQDILIDKIPWNLSISKLPWIEKIIFTDW